MLESLSFVCIAVSNLEKATETYTKLFDLKVMSPPHESDYGYISTFLGNGKVPLIELIEPTRADSAVAKFMQKRGEGVYLVAFEVNALDEAVKEVRSRGGRVTGIPEGEEPGPEVDYVWVHPRSTPGAFIELKRVGGSLLS